MNRTTINVANYDNDTDFAAMIGEATKGFSIDEFMRLRALACTVDAPPLLSR